MTCPSVSCTSRAHPRVGGENCCSVLSVAQGVGSSPRGRGKRSFRTPTSCVFRLIPAWAGKTVHHPDHPGGPRAHPRVGGENRTAGRGVRGSTGSSPRGRGKHRSRPKGLALGGLIPAWAGKTIYAASLPPAHAAHPRVGGENGVIEAEGQLRQGSSPRGRGKRAGHGQESPAARLIPAWAGKTVSAPARYMWTAAHPRVGGENEFHGGLLSVLLGSSPRGRGKPRHTARGGWVPRLIPAWAGKTHTSAVSRARS